MWCHRDPSVRRRGVGNIFIRNLSPSIDNKALNSIFSMFGNILSCKVATDNTGKSKGYGFVHFETQEAANKAMETFDQSELEGQVVTVVPFQSRRERMRHNEEVFTNVYVKDLPAEVDSEKLEEIFGERAFFSFPFLSFFLFCMGLVAWQFLFSSSTSLSCSLARSLFLSLS